MAIAKIDGAIQIPPASWSVYSGDVYTATLSCSSDCALVSDDSFTVWGPSGEWLTRVTSAVGMPFSSYYVSDYAAVGTPRTVYLRTSDGSNPSGQSAYYQNYYGPLMAMEGLVGQRIIGPVHLTRSLCANGEINIGKSAYVTDVMLSKGGKHNCVAESGVFEDTVAFDIDMGRSVLNDGGYFSFTFYTADGTNIDFEYRRVLDIHPSGREVAVSPVYAHTSNDNTPYRNGIVNGLVSQGSGLVQMICQNQQLNDVWLMGKSYGLAGSHPAMLTRSMQRCFTAMSEPTMGGSLITNAVAVGANLVSEVADCGLIILTSAASAAYVGLNFTSAETTNIHHNVIYSQPSSGLTRVVDITGARHGSQCRNNIIIAPAGTDAHAIMQLDSANGVVPDYNVYIELGVQGYFRDMSGSLTTDLATWKSWGFDANSVELNSTQANQLFLNGISGLLAGDFRINPSYAGTFTDGTPIVGNAGIRQYMDWSTQQIVNGQPSRWVTPPTTEADCEAYTSAPQSWSW